jgi:hypothetical protein
MCFQEPPQAKILLMDKIGHWVNRCQLSAP